MLLNWSRYCSLYGSFQLVSLFLFTGVGSQFSSFFFSLFLGLCRCAFMNFASNTKCLRCPELRPKRQLNPGEWECPSWVTFLWCCMVLFCGFYSSYFWILVQMWLLELQKKHGLQEVWLWTSQGCKEAVKIRAATLDKALLT